MTSTPADLTLEIPPAIFAELTDLLRSAGYGAVITGVPPYLRCDMTGISLEPEVRDDGARPRRPAMVVGGAQAAGIARGAFPGFFVTWPGCPLTGRAFQRAIWATTPPVPGSMEERWMLEALQTRLPPGARIEMLG